MDYDDERKITENYEQNNMGVTIYHDPYKLIIRERNHKTTKKLAETKRRS